MKYKKEFLAELEKKLASQNIDPKDAIEYYGELIDERVADGKTEKTVIKELGDINAIVSEIEIDKQVDKAVEKPTISNGTKALIAVLGVLSLPILIPVVLVVVALLITFSALVFSFIATLIALIIAVIASVIGLFVSVFMGYMPAYWLAFCVGVMLIIVPLCVEGIRGLVYIFRKAIVGLASLIRKKQSKEGEK